MERYYYILYLLNWVWWGIKVLQEWFLKLWVDLFSAFWLRSSEVMSRKQMNNFKQWEKSSSCVGVLSLESKESNFIGSTLGIIDPHFLKGDIETNCSLLEAHTDAVLKSGHLTPKSSFWHIYCHWEMNTCFWIEPKKVYLEAQP